MTMTCPKCGHQRTSADDPAIPAAQCPACGIYYLKYVSQKSGLSRPQTTKTKSAKLDSINLLHSLKDAVNIRRISIILIVVISIVWLTGRFYLGPSTTMNDVRHILIQGNASDLDKYVDFTKVKINIKSRLKVKMTQNIEKLKGNPFADLGIIMADTVLDKLVNNLISPDGLKAMAAKWDNDKRSLETVYFPLNYNGLNHATVIINSNSSIEMERSGLFSWKIIDMIFPLNPTNT